MARKDLFAIALLIFATILGQLDAQDAVCNTAKVEECMDPVDAVALNTDLTYICSVLKTAKTCLESLVSACQMSDPEGQLEKAQYYLKEVVIHRLSTECGKECSWVALSECVSAMGTINANSSLAESCPVFQESKACLLNIGENCGDDQIVSSINSTIESLEMTLVYCPKDGNSSGAGCDYVALQKCADPLAPIGEMSSDNHDFAKICPLLRDGVDCFMKLEKVCNGTNAQMTLMIGSSMTGLEAMKPYCPGDGHDGNTTASGCHLLALKECTDPMASISDMTGDNFDLEKICPLVKNGIDCIEKLEELCDGTSSSMSTLIKSSMTGLDSLKPYCPRGNTSPTQGPPGNTTECSWVEYIKCAGDMAGYNESTPLEESCPVMTYAKKCLSNMDTDCPDPAITTAVKTVLDAIDFVIPFCPEDKTTTPGTIWPTHAPTGGTHITECSWVEYVKCAGDMEGYNDKTPLEVSCPVMKYARKCLHNMNTDCLDATLKSTIKQTLDSINFWIPYCPAGTTPDMTWPTGMPTTDSPVTGTSHRCDWLDFYGCSDLLDTIQGVTNNNCKIWWKSKHCMTSIHDHCPMGPIKDLIRSTLRTWEEKMADCKDLCHGGMVDDCLLPTKAGNDFEYKCSVSGKAKTCLMGVRERCENNEVAKWIDDYDMGWLQNHMDECMKYGHETGLGSYTGDGDRDHNKASGVTRDLSSLLISTLTLVTWLILR